MLFILYLTPDRSYIVVDRAHGREELLLNVDRRKRLCREVLFRYLFSSWTCGAGYVTVEECEYKREEADIEEESLTIIVNIVK